MNRHERRAQKAREKAETAKPAQSAQALAVLQAAILRNAIDGRLLEALSGCREALALDPDNADTAHLMALVHLEAKQHEHAIEWASRALARETKPAYLATLALALSNLGRHDDAVNAFDRAIELKGDDAQLWWQKGNMLLGAQRLPEALASFEQTLKLDPRNADAAYKCGHILHALERFDEAMAPLDRSAMLQPRDPATLHLRAIVLKELNRLDEALSDNLRALELDPENAEIIGNVGVILHSLGRPTEALTWHDRALQMAPRSARHIMNRGTTLVELGRRDEAITTYEHAIAVDPGFLEAQWNLALLRLQMGEFEAGWKGKELRWHITGLKPAYPKLAGPMWLGEQPLDGKTILVCTDEGLGDTINFARYVPLLTQRGARVILVVEPALCPLLSNVEGVSACLPKLPDTVLPPYDFHCPINSLPLAFGTRLDSIPKAAYLPQPRADRVQAWQERLEAHDRLRVGLVWSGNPKTKNDRNRSMTFRTMSRLLDLDARFVSLQKDPRPEDAELLRERADMVDFTAEFTDFAETAALVSCLDLVIAVDTSTAHLAGSLGKPTWLLLPFMSDYRWMFDREDSPWYPTMRLFRQSADRDFAAVVDRVRAELQVLADGFSH
jgi:tetratricopeptide (TPR) repeat protein/ADP-heptose:LPS heptosyltransferase